MRMLWVRATLRLGCKKRRITWTLKYYERSVQTRLTPRHQDNTSAEHPTTHGAPSTDRARHQMQGDGDKHANLQQGDFPVRTHALGVLVRPRAVHRPDGARPPTAPPSSTLAGRSRAVIILFICGRAPQRRLLNRVNRSIRHLTSHFTPIWVAIPRWLLTPALCFPRFAPAKNGAEPYWAGAFWTVALFISSSSLSLRLSRTQLLIIHLYWGWGGGFRGVQGRFFFLPDLRSARTHRLTNPFPEVPGCTSAQARLLSWRVVGARRPPRVWL